MYRVGFGKDIHRLKKGLPLIIGGINIPFDKGLESFTDGDVLLHSLIDAIFGAIGEKDIGEHFPQYEKYRATSSSILLKETANILLRHGYKISSIDTMISIEKPCLKEYKGRIKENIASLLNIDKNLIAVKAGTNEGLGEIGKGKAIEAYSIVLVEEITNGKKS